jgi:hypothetical protein
MSAVSGGKRIAVWKKSFGHCWYCGLELGESLHIDHMVAVSLGGTNEIDNLFPSCKRCNTRKHTMSLESFRRFMSMDGVRFSSKQRALLKQVILGNFNALSLLEEYETVHFGQYKFWFERNGL